MRSSGCGCGAGGDRGGRAPRLWGEVRVVVAPTVGGTMGTKGTGRCKDVFHASQKKAELSCLVVKGKEGSKNNYEKK